MGDESAQGTIMALGRILSANTRGTDTMRQMPAAQELAAALKLTATSRVNVLIDPTILCPDVPPEFGCRASSYAGDNRSLSEGSAGAVVLWRSEESLRRLPQES
uniref:Uncharacterized protein n=1 Tax=Romanomermis culicivorax TaxID=13658 RepID=A0A915JWK1_ROMCU